MGNKAKEINRQEKNLIFIVVEMVVVLKLFLGTTASETAFSSSVESASATTVEMLMTATVSTILLEVTARLSAVCSS